MSNETIVADDDKYVKFGTMKKMFKAFYEQMPKGGTNLPPIDINITFDAGDGEFVDGNKTLSTVGYAGETLILPESLPVRLGYALEGWFTQDGKRVDENTVNSIRDVTYYAHWKAETYNIRLMFNYVGSPVETCLTVTYGEMPPKIPVPEREGYEFLGFFESSFNLNSEQYFDESGNPIKEWTKTEDITIYALWREETVLKFDQSTGRYTNESISAWLDEYSDGLIYGVNVPLFSYNTSGTASKTDSNYGLVLEPSSNTVEGRNDYLGKKLFMCTRVNGGVDSDGMPYVTSIEGQDDRFDCKAENTFALTPVYYVKHTVSSTHILQQYSDSPHADYVICPGAYLPDGETIRPYILRACYMDSDGQFTSKSGTLPATRTSSSLEGYYQHTFSNIVTSSINRPDGLSFLSYGDVAYQIEFMQLMLGVKAPKLKVKGTIASLSSYKCSESSSGKTVVLSSANGTKFRVGAYVNIGTSSIESSVDNCSIAQAVRITDVSTSGTKTTLTLDLPESIETTTDNYVTFSRYRNGSCDNIQGTYGCFDLSGMTDGKTPFRFQNIEYGLGVGEIVSNILIYNSKLYLAANIKACSGVNTSSGWVNSYGASVPSGSFYIGDYSTIGGAKIPKSITGATSFNNGYMVKSSHTSSTNFQGVAVNGSKSDASDNGVGYFYAVSTTLGNSNFGTRISAIGQSKIVALKS